MVEHHVANVRVVSSNLITRLPYRREEIVEEEQKKTKEEAAPKKESVKPRPDLLPHPVEKTSEEEAVGKQEEREAEGKPLEYESDALRVRVARKSGCLMEMTVHAKESLVVPAHKKAIRAVSKQVSLPGFRKGKGPDDLILKNYPKEIDKHWEQILADGAFKECLKLAKIPILDTSTEVKFKMDRRSLKGGADLILTFETTPEPPAVDPKTLELQAVDAPLLDEEKIAEAIHQVRFYFATWKRVEDRTVCEGDYLLLDLDDLETTPPSRVYSDIRFEVSDKRMAHWMKELVLDMKTQESKEGVSKPDPDATEEEKKLFQPKRVRVTVKAIEEAELPPVDDKLAMMLGVTTVAEIHSSVKQLLQKQIDDHVQKNLREQISALLLSKHPFDLPPSLIEKESRFRLEQLAKDPKFIQFWKVRSEKERKEIIQEIYDQSEKAVRMFYLCRKIIIDAKISITSDDIPKPGSTPLEILLQPSPEVHFKESPEVGHAETYSRLVMEKAEDYLITHATKTTQKEPVLDK